MRRNSSSQVSWALLAEGVAGTRVLVHRMRQYLNRAQKILSEIPKEDLAEHAGDLTKVIPELQDSIEQELDGLSYAISLMGQEFLRNRLPVDARKDIEFAVESADHKNVLHKESFDKYRKQLGTKLIESRNYYKRNRAKVRMKARVRYRKQKVNPKYKLYRKQYRANPNRFRKVAAEDWTFVWDPRDQLGRLEGIQDDFLLIRLADGTLGKCGINTFAAATVYMDESDLDADYDRIDQVWGSDDPVG